MKIPCSSCNQRLEIPEELAGQTIECPACKASLAVPAIEAPPTVAPQVRVAIPSERITTAQEVAAPKTNKKISYTSNDNSVSTLNDFLPEKVLISVGVIGLIGGDLFRSLFSGRSMMIDIQSIVGLLLLCLICAHLFRLGSDKVCGIDIDLRGAFVTTLFCIGISSFIHDLVGLVIYSKFYVYVIIMAVVMAYVIELRLQKGIKAAIYISLRINAATFLILLLFWLIPHFQLMRQVKSNASIMGGSKVSYSYSPTSRKESNEAAKQYNWGTAVKGGDIATVKEHLASGTDVNEVNRNGLTPLFEAASAGHKEIVELLIDKGADVNAKVAGIGVTPLDEAIEWQRVIANPGVRKPSAKTKRDLDRYTSIIATLRKHGGKTGEELKAEGK